MSPVRLRTAVPVLLALFLFGGCVNTEITEPVQHEELKLDEIRKGILSGDVKVKLEAERQLERYPDDVRLGVLEDIRREGDPQARLLVIEQLGKLGGNERARAILVEMRDQDPDRIVRFKAKKTLAELERPQPPATP